MDDYQRKPFTADQLGPVLQRWLKREKVDPSAATGGSNGIQPSQERDARTAQGEAGLIDKNVLEGIRALQQPGAPDVVAKIVGTFLSSSGDLVGELEAAVKSGDTEVIQRSAHTLKSSSANIGAIILAELCKELESIGREQRLDDAPSVLAKVLAEYPLVCDALQRELSNTEPG